MLCIDDASVGEKLQCDGQVPRGDNRRGSCICDAFSVGEIGKTPFSDDAGES